MHANNITQRVSASNTQELLCTNHMLSHAPVSALLRQKAGAHDWEFGERPCNGGSRATHEMQDTKETALLFAPDELSPMNAPAAACILPHSKIIWKPNAKESFDSNMSYNTIRSLRQHFKVQL